MSFAEDIYAEAKGLPDAKAREVLDFIGYLKYQEAKRASVSTTHDTDSDGDGDWAEFEKLAGSWEGRFDREACYDRPILR